MKRKIANVVISFLLVTSLLVGSTASVSAQPQECNTAELAATWVTTGLVHLTDTVDCNVFGDGVTTDDVREVREAEENQTKLDLYSAGLSQQSQNENFGTVYDNYLQDTETVAWSKAEVAIAEAWENGKTKEQARIDAKEAISGYYTPKQINLINSWNSSALAWYYLKERAIQESSISNGFVTAKVTNHGTTVHQEADTEYRGLQNETVPLVNGSSATTVGLRFQLGYDGGDTATVRSGQISHSTQTDVTFKANYPLIQAPNDNYEQYTYMDFTEYSNRWNKIETKNENMQQEAANFVNGTWSELESGVINSSDVISRNTLMFEYGTKSSENRSYYDTIGALASMGLDTPDLNGTGQMSFYINDTMQSYNGMVFARNVPEGTWTVGEVYNADNITGPVMYATTNGSSGEINGDFVITEAKTKNGDSVTTVETTKYNYQTSNTSELLEKQNRILELTQELQNRSEVAGTGGGLDTSNVTLPDWLTQKYADVPVWGWLIVISLIGYVGNSVRGN